MELILTEHAKKLIDEFGFIPLGGIIFPDGRKSWEIDYESQDKNIKYIPGTPYLDIGLKIHELNPTQFKNTYKGVYSQYFKYVRNHHNKYLGKVKTLSKLYKLWNSGKPTGVIYKATQVRDADGNPITNGPIIITASRYDRGFGLHRLGRTIDWKQRINTYANSKNNYHFENAIRKYLKVEKEEDRKLNMFRFEILAVCTSEKEFIATEYFWTLFYNKKNHKDGFDLGENKYLNPIIGSWNDEVFKFNIPKYELINDILKGLQPKEILIKNENEFSASTLYSRLNFYFRTQSTYEILKSLVAPYIDRCFRNGYTEQEALNYLFKIGIYAFDNDYYDKRESVFGSMKRIKPYNLFNKILRDLYPNLVENNEEKTIYEQIQETFFLTYGELLIGLKSIDELAILYQGGRYKPSDPAEFHIIENLFKNDYSLQDIALKLGLSNDDADVDSNKNAEIIIYEYLQELRGSINIKKKSSESLEDLKHFLKNKIL